MNLIKLEASIKQIRHYNWINRYCRKKYPDIFKEDFSYAKTSDDLFFPYQRIIDDKENDKYLTVKDDNINFTGVYIQGMCTNSGTLGKWSNYLVPDDDEYTWHIATENDRISFYGVSDNATQVIKYFNDFENRNEINLGDCVIIMSPILKDTQPKCNGWRWHKWGRYIGEKHPTAEYLADEPDIPFVWCWHLYRVIKKREQNARNFN